MERYMDDLIYRFPIPITKSIDSILISTSSSKTVYEYLVWYFTLKYERSKIMDSDAVFVHMANAYFKTGKLILSVSPSGKYNEAFRYPGIPFNW